MESKKRYYNTTGERYYKVEKLSKGIDYVRTEEKRLFTLFDGVIDAFAGIRGLFLKFWFICMLFGMVLDKARKEGVFPELFNGAEFGELLVEYMAFALMMVVPLYCCCYMFGFFTRYAGNSSLYTYNSPYGVVYVLIHVFGSALMLIAGYKLFSLLITLGYIQAFYLTILAGVLLSVLVCKLLYCFRGRYIRKHLTEEELEKYCSVPIGTAENKVQDSESEEGHGA